MLALTTGIVCINLHKFLACKLSGSLSTYHPKVGSVKLLETVVMYTDAKLPIFSIFETVNPIN